MNALFQLNTGKRAVWFLMVFAVAFSLIPLNAHADRNLPLTALEYPLNVDETAQELMNKGCTVREDFYDEARGLDVVSVPTPSRNFRRVSPSDEWFFEDEYYWCTNEIVEKLSATTDTSGPISYLITALNWIFAIYASIGLFFLDLAMNLLVAILGARQFITHPMVRQGWPFLLGIANLGFLLAVLFIAALTVLRIDIGGGVRRTLPRLLIAAVLINFSLVIGGVLIDVSRIVMATILVVVSPDFLTAGPNRLGVFDQFGSKILQGSGLLHEVFDNASLEGRNGFFLQFNEDNINGSSWAMPLKVLQAAALIWILTIGALVASLALFFRYIILILLLIASPFAYLAAAFPGAEGLAKKWWSHFIKWVLFGPAAVFILALAIVLPTGTDVQIFGIDNLALGQMFNIVLTGALMASSVVAAQALGAAGSNFALNTAKPLAKRAGKTGALPATLIGRGIKRGGDKLYNSNLPGVARTRKAIRGAQGSFAQATKAREEQKKKEQQVGKDRYKAKAGNKSMSSGQRAEMNAATVYAGRMRGTADEVDFGPTGSASASIMSASALRKGHIARGLYAGNRNAIGNIAKHGERSQIEAVFKNKELIRDMSESDIAGLETNLLQNRLPGAADAKDRASLLSELQKTIDAVEKEKSGGDSK